MDSSKGLKRLLDFESQNEIDRDEAKGQHMLLGSIGDDFEEFLALLDRIQHMKANNMYFGMPEETFLRGDPAVKVIKTKSPWIPSFVWEDFRVSAAKDTMVSAEGDRCCPPPMDNPIISEESRKQINEPTDHLKMRSSSDIYDSRPAS